MHVRLARFAELVRKHSIQVVKSCARNCECICAFKLHRAQQVYRRFWGVPRSRSLLKALRTRTILLGSSTIALFNWQTQCIPESILKDHYQDIEHVRQLTQDTLTCRNCSQRIIVDIPAPNIKYCSCGSKGYAAQGALDGWKPFIERQDLLVWRRECDSRPGLFEYKLYGVYPEVAPDVFLQVQVDSKYREEWDKSAVSVRVIEVDPETRSQVLYWEMKWPRFFSNRDYVFNRRYIIDHKSKVIVIRSETTDHAALPENKGKFRVKEYYCTMVIKSLRSKFDEPGVEFCMTYFDNPGLSLPTAVQTWVATSAMPDFLLRLRNASVQYALRHQSGSRGCSGDPPVFNVVNEAIRVK